MKSKTVILVTGATGMAGQSVCEELSRVSGTEVRAAVHSPAKQELLPAGVAAIPFDTDDPASVHSALAGVDRLFLVTPGGPLGPPATRVIVDAARAHRVSRIVKLSSITPELPPQAPTDIWALEAEAMVRDSGIPFSFLRPPWFFQNFSHGYFTPMIMQRTLTLPFGEGRAGWVDTRDIAATAVKALLEEGHQGRIYTPTGPEAISLSEIAKILSDATGEEIRFQHLSDDQWIAGALAAGRSEIDAHATLALIAKTRDGHHEPHVTDDVERLTGRPPRSFRQFARDYAPLLSALAATPATPRDP